MNLNIVVNESELDKSKYIIATYYLQSEKSIYDAAWNIAVGQSIGNPNVRSVWETQELINDHCCKIVVNDKFDDLDGRVKIAFPIANISWVEDGVSQLLCQLMGGHLDINSIKKCKLVDIEFPEYKTWNQPKFGISGIRQFTQVYDKPLLGGIVKPKIGISPEVLLNVVKEMCDNGVNFIKEDEIMSNPRCCDLDSRANIIIPYLQKEHPDVVYCFCVNADYPYCIDRVKKIADLGGNGVHINVWNGLGVYKTIRDLDLPLFIHFQKSGDKIFTTGHNFSIAWPVVCQLAGMMGVDFIHAGMWGGYSNDENLEDCIKVLHSHGVMPALSCGMHPGLVNKTTELFGCDYMANVGGAIHGHPGGTGAGVRAMRQAIDKNFGEEYDIAIDTWGLIE